MRSRKVQGRRAPRAGQPVCRSGLRESRYGAAGSDYREAGSRAVATAKPLFYRLFWRWPAIDELRRGRGVLARSSMPVTVLYHGSV